MVEGILWVGGSGWDEQRYSLGEWRLLEVFYGLVGVGGVSGGIFWVGCCG